MEQRTPGAAIDIRSIGWQRVQLHIEATLQTPGPGEEGGGAPLGFHLRQLEGPGVVPLTHAETDGDRLRLRINVMQGPDLQPLAVGRWRLEARATKGGADRPVQVVDPAAVDAGRDAVVFPLRGGAYQVEPAVSGPEHQFMLTVSFDATGGLVQDLDLRARLRMRFYAPLRAARVAALRVLLAGLRVVPGSGRRRILFSSDSRGALAGNLKDVHDRMIERGLDREFTIQTLFKGGITERRGMRDRLRLPWLLAGADVIVIDDYQPVIYRMGVDPDVRIIQLWHASGAFKTVGYSRVGKPGGPDPYSRVHKNYSHAIVSSDHDVPFYAEAFGIPESRVVPTGIPRMDRFFDPAARAAGLAAARAAFPASDGRTTILFAPTFRGDGARTASYDLGLIDYGALHALAVEKDAVVIIKMHPFVTTPLGIPATFTDRILDGSSAPIDVNDLLFAVDLLITDYSSIVFEFSTLGRPMLFFAYDLDDYVATRDFYVPFGAFVPGRIVRTFAELLDAIRTGDDDTARVAAFAARHFAHLDGGSTDRVIDQLIVRR